MFKQSLNEFSKTRNIVIMAMLCAVNVVTSWISIPLSDTLKITFSFLSMSLIGHLFGPSCGAICGLALGTIKFIIKPSGPYNPLWAIIEMLAGVIYGVMLYKKTATIKRCFITKFIVSLLLNVILTPLFLSFMYSKGFIYYMSTRVLKNLILWPIESMLMFIIINRIDAYMKTRSK